MNSKVTMVSLNNYNNLFQIMNKRVNRFKINYKLKMICYKTKTNVLLTRLILYKLH